MSALKTGEQTRRKTVTRTFRINEEWDRILQEEAEKQGITVSALMSQILCRYVTSERFFERYQNITIGNKTLNAVIKKTSARNLATVGKSEGAIRPREQLLTVGLQPNFGSVCWLIEEIYDRNNYWYRCEHHVIKEQNVFNLIHNIDKNWSIFIGSYMASMFKALLNVDVTTEIEDDSVTVYVDNKLVSF